MRVVLPFAIIAFVSACGSRGSQFSLTSVLEVGPTTEIVVARDTQAFGFRKPEECICSLRSADWRSLGRDMEPYLTGQSREARTFNARGKAEDCVVTLDSTTEVILLTVEAVGKCSGARVSLSENMAMRIAIEW